MRAAAEKGHDSNEEELVRKITRRGRLMVGKEAGVGKDLVVRVPT